MFIHRNESMRQRQRQRAYFWVSEIRCPLEPQTIDNPLLLWDFHQGLSDALFVKKRLASFDQAQSFSEILKAFATFPNVTFLWKYEDDCGNDTTPFGDYDNVILKSWIPQTDLLGDDRVKAFITHAGMNSLLESSYRGKPMITVPLFGDQYVNAKTTREAGISLLIKRTELSKNTLVTALTEVLDPER